MYNADVAAACVVPSTKGSCSPPCQDGLRGALVVAARVPGMPGAVLVFRADKPVPVAAWILEAAPRLLVAPTAEEAFAALPDGRCFRLAAEAPADGVGAAAAAALPAATEVRAAAPAKRKPEAGPEDLLAADPRYGNLNELETAGDVCDAVMGAVFKPLEI